MADTATMGAALRDAWVEAPDYSPSDDGIVRCVSPGSSRVYHYRCPEARIGDRVFHPSLFGPAAVIGYGRLGYSGRVRDIDLYDRGSPQAGNALRGRLDADVKFTSSLHRSLIDHKTQENRTMNDKIAVKTTAAAQIEEHEDEIKRLRKAEKRAKKIARERARIAAERAAHKKLAVDTLAEIAADARVCKSDRIEAAVALHRIFA